MSGFSLNKKDINLTGKGMNAIFLAKTSHFSTPLIKSQVKKR